MALLDKITEKILQQIDGSGFQQKGAYHFTWRPADHRSWRYLSRSFRSSQQRSSSADCRFNGCFWRS